MKLATTTHDFARYCAGSHEQLALLRQAGFRYADYNFCGDYAKQNGVYSADWEAYADLVKRTARQLPIQLVQAHAPMGRPLAEGEREELIEATKRAVACCGTWGIRHLVVHTGYLPDLSKEETFERNRAFFHELLPAAERQGVTLLAENFNRMFVENIYWIDSAADLKEFLDYVDHPLVKACWDAGHGNMQQTTQRDALNLLGKYVKAIHVQDNRGDEDTHGAPLFGTLDIDSLMQGLRDIDYKGYFTFEACNMLSAAAPLEIQLKAERLLYDIGEWILRSHGCFEP